MASRVRAVSASVSPLVTLDPAAVGLADLGRPGGGLRVGPAIGWREAAQLPLCLLTPDMHNRSIVDSAFAGLGLAVKPVMETNSILALALSVKAGRKVSLFDVDKYSWGGDVSLYSANGNIRQAAGSRIDLSAKNNQAGNLSVVALADAAGMVDLQGERIALTIAADHHGSTITFADA